MYKTVGTEIQTGLKESAVRTLSDVLGPVATRSILAYIQHSETMEGPEDLNVLLSLLFGQTGSNVIQERMLKSVSEKLDGPSVSPAAGQSFDPSQINNKTILFNRMHAIIAALQPRSLPRRESDLRVTATDGLTFETRTTESSYAGEYFHTAFERVRRIIVHQFKTRTTTGIKGFIFQGPPGTGKTVMARALARDISLQFIYLDSSTVARSRYGESEKQIVAAFDQARRKPSLILIDDAEAMFPSRDSEESKEYHTGQNNVLFHELDGIDTSVNVVILTTNKPEQLDPALSDRLYPIQFPELSLETVIEIAKLKCLQRQIQPDEVLRRIREAPVPVKSVRTIEKMVMEEYILGIERAEAPGAKN